MHRFIIVGGGAGGLELATRLGDKFGSADGKRAARAQVTLIDRNSTHIWKPLLHEVAAGSMDPFSQELPYAAQARWHGFEFQQGDLLGVDRTAKRVTLGPLLDDEAGELMPQRDLEYDTLIVAIGSTTAFFGVQGAQENSLALDTVDQAELFRKRLRRYRRRQSSQTIQAVAHARCSQRLDDLLVQAIHERTRRRGGGERADPELIVGIGKACLRRRRYVR